MAKNDLHVFSGDLQPFEPAIFGDDVPFGFFRAVHRREARDNTVGCDHSQNVETLDDRAGVGHESLVPPALPRDMRVGGLEADEILKMETFDLRYRMSADSG